MELYATRQVYRSKEEEKAIRSYLDMPLTLEEEWQRHFNVERKRLYNAIHPEYKTRDIDPYPRPKDDPLRPVKGDVYRGLNFVRTQKTLPEPYYLIEYGSTWRMSMGWTSDRDLLYIGNEKEFPKKLVKSLIEGFEYQHHGALTATKEMLSYWPLDLIPPFMIQSAFDHGEHHKLALWGTWYHREAVEEFIRSVMYWRTWKDREGPKDEYETALLCSMATMFPCIFESACRRPKPKAMANLMRPETLIAAYAYNIRAGRKADNDLLKVTLMRLDEEADEYMEAFIKQGFLS